MPTGYRPDVGPILIGLTVLAGLSLGLMWLSPLLSLIITASSLSLLAVLRYPVTDAHVWTIVVTSFVTAAFDGLVRAIVASFVVVAVVITAVAAVEIDWRIMLSAWIVFSLIWMIAIVVRVYRGSVERANRRAALFAADREARAREAVTAERTRLAREFHDSVGHALNVVVLHAGAAQRLLTQEPETAREALASIEVAGRQAIDDVERMLDVLRESGTEDDGLTLARLGELDELCESVREAGLPVELVVTGERRELPTSNRSERLPDHPGGAHERAQARRAHEGHRVADVRAASVNDRGRRLRPRGAGARLRP